MCMAYMYCERYVESTRMYAELRALLTFCMHVALLLAGLTAARSKLKKQKCEREEPVTAESISDRLM